jgi:hypothetical protein
MNKLSVAQRAQTLSMLVEASSMRSVSCIAEEMSKPYTGY